MIRDISDDIATNIKDRLREFRYMIRRNRSDNITNRRLEASSTSGPDQSVLDAPDIILGHAARVMDKALTKAENISLSLLSGDPSIHHSAPDVRSIAVYFSAGFDGQHAFHRDMYYLTKEILRRRHADNMLIHETAFAAIHASVNRNHRDLIRDVLQANTIEATARLCTALLTEMIAENPVRFADGRKVLPETAQAIRNRDITGFASICLACGLATAKAADMEGVNNLESALLAIEARTDRLVAAFDASNKAALDALFGTLISHLP